MWCDGAQVDVVWCNDVFLYAVTEQIAVCSEGGRTLHMASSRNWYANQSHSTTVLHPCPAPAPPLRVELSPPLTTPTAAGLGTASPVRLQATTRPSVALHPSTAT